MKEGIYLDVGLPYFGGNLKAYKATMENILKDCKKKVVLIEKHFLAGDLKNYAIEAHSVKSVSASIGATGFSDLAKDNELKAKAEDREYIEANGAYFVSKYKEFINSIEQILAEERHFEAEAHQELAEKELVEVDADSSSVGIGEGQEEGKQQKVKERIQEAIDAIDDFETDTASRILQELHAIDMDAVLLDKLCQANELIDDFEYDQAVEILKKIIE